MEMRERYGLILIVQNTLFKMMINDRNFVVCIINLSSRELKPHQYCIITATAVFADYLCKVVFKLMKV